MAWIQVEQNIINHKKTLRAIRLLNISKITLIGHLNFLWIWAIDNIPDGIFPKEDIIVIEDACLWEGEEGAFISALVKAGFIDECSTGFSIHNWDEYGGKYAEQRERRSEANKRYYENQKNLKKLNKTDLNNIKNTEKNLNATNKTDSDRLDKIRLDKIRLEKKREEGEKKEEVQEKETKVVPASDVNNFNASEDKPPCSPPLVSVLEKKLTFGEFGLVKLTEAEQEKLLDKLGDEDFDFYVSQLDGHLKQGECPDKYKNQYAALLNWKRRDEKNNKRGSPKNSNESKAKEVSTDATSDYFDQLECCQLI